METKQVLLTGATGLVGQHVIPLLLAQGYQVHSVTSRFEYKPDVQENVTWYCKNLLDSRQVEELVQTIKPTHLLHLAWAVETGKFWTSPTNLSWVGASLNLLKAFAQYDGRRVVMAGSCAEYDWTKNEIYVEDTSQIKPTTLYGASKNAVREVLEAFSATHKMSYGWGRLFLLYGPNEFEKRVVASVIRALLKDEPALCSEGLQVRDFSYSFDVARAYVSLLNSQVTGAVNIASGSPISVRDLITKIATKLNKLELVRFGAISTPAHDPPMIAGDISRLRNEVGCQPQFDIDQGIEQTIEWWRQHL